MVGRLRGIALSVVAGVGACGPAVKAPLPLPVQPGPHEIVLYDYKFNPPRLVIPSGTTVTWINMDLIRHTVTAQFLAEPFDSKNLNYQMKYSYTFTKPGEYRYICVPHPGMQGIIVVE